MSAVWVVVVWGVCALGVGLFLHTDDDERGRSNVRLLITLAFLALAVAKALFGSGWLR